MSITKIRELRDQRTRVLEAARELVERAEAEERDLTPQEQRQYDELLQRAERLKSDIERFEVIAAIQDGRGNELADAPALTASMHDQRSSELRAFGSFLVERRALGEGTGSAGGYLVPDEAATEVVRYLSANTVALQSGVRLLRPQRDRLLIPRLDAGATAGWYGENAQITASDQQFGQITLIPRKLAAMTIVSNELLRDSSPEAGRVVAEDLTRALSLELDRAFFLGSGSGQEPTGLLNTTGVSVVDVGTDGAAPSIDHVLSAMGLLREDNTEPRALVLHPRDLSALVKSKDSSNRYLLDGFSADALSRALGLQVFVTSQLPTNRTKGTATDASVAFVYDPRYIFVAIRQDIEVVLDGSRYFEYDQTAIRATMRVDFAVAWPQAVAVIDGWTAA